MPASDSQTRAPRGRTDSRTSRPNNRPARISPSERAALIAQPWHNSSLNDAELLAAAIERQDWAWPAIVHRYTGLITSVTISFGLLGDDAAEVRQEVWARLFENLPRIRHHERIVGWIHAVARNECLRLRTKHNREVVSLDDTDFAGDSHDEMDGQVIASERYAALHSAIDGLPEQGRALLETLLEAPDLSYCEVAAKLGIPVGSIGPTRQRCLKKLRATPGLARLQR